GCGLVLTVDCGITAVEEVAEARARGLDVGVTDHHRPGAALPDCPGVATLVGEYPFGGLCGTGVVWQLAQALLPAAHPLLTRPRGSATRAPRSSCSSATRPARRTGWRQSSSG